MVKVRRWFAVVVVLVLGLTAQPAHACYRCTLHIYCTSSCWYWYDCADAGIGCSGCYEGCLEGFDTCQEMGGLCQWALFSPTEVPQPQSTAERETSILASLLSEVTAQAVWRR
jgi:hypothetical protein